MKKLCAILAAILAVVTAGALFAAQEVPGAVTVREDRPRVWFTPERLAALREKFESDPFPVSDDDAGARALRYVLTGNKEDARFAIDYILKFDLSEEVLTESVASDHYRWGAFIPIIYDWCNDQMTEDEKARFLARYGRIVEMMNKKSWGGPRMPGNNYYAGYMRNSGIFGMAAFGETPYAAGALENAFVTRWENSSLPYFAGGARGGVAGEGTQYDRYNIGYITWLAEAAKTAAGRDLYRETNWLREFAYYVIYSTTPAEARVKDSDDIYYQRFPFGDDQFDQGHPSVDEIIGDSMRAVALEYAGETVGGHAAAYLDEVEPEAGLFGWVIEDGRETELVELSDLPLDYYLPGCGFAFLRSSWETAATGVMLQLDIPKKSGHHHLDLGSFQMVRGGSWLTKESTGYGHQFADCNSRSAGAHNALLFDGRGQAGGHADGAPKVRAVQSHEKFFHAVTGMTGAYRAQESPRLGRDDNPSAGMCVREFLFIRPDLLIIFDRMTATAPEVKKTFLLHLPLKPEVDENNTFTMVNGGSRLIAQFVYPTELETALVDMGDFEGQKRAPAYYQWRLDASQSGEKEGYFLTVLASHERFDMPPKCELIEKEDTIGLQVRQPGRRCEVHFNKAMSDVFGHMVIEEAGAHGYLETDLVEAVQPITVDADGVHWGQLGAR